MDPGTSIYIADSRVQFVLDDSNIFFWQDDSDWDWSCTMCASKANDMLDKYVTSNGSMPAEIKNNTINIFWGGNFTGSYSGQAFALGSKTWIWERDSKYTYYSGWDGPQKVIDNLSHELGHTLGLLHNFGTQCDICSDNDPSTTP